MPLLSDVPVLGRLFKTDTKKLTNMERFYMLTPRFVIPGDGGVPAAVSAAPVAPLQVPPASNVSPDPGSAPHDGYMPAGERS